MGMGGALWCEESELGGAKLRFALPTEGAVAESEEEAGNDIGQIGESGEPLSAIADALNPGG